MNFHWLCRGVIISAVVAGQSKLSRDIMDRAYIFMACNKYPPPPEVVIMGWVRPGSTCANVGQLVKSSHTNDAILDSDGASSLIY